MNPPKFDICIEGYNTEQTDFYISYLIDKYNSCEQNYKNALNKISELENENEKLRSDFLALTKKIGGNVFEIEIINRLKKIEEILGTESQEIISSSSNHEQEAEIASFEEKLKDFKSLLNF